MRDPSSIRRAAVLRMWLPASIRRWSTSRRSLARWHHVIA